METPLRAMVPPAPDAAPPRSSLLYAMGKLTATVEAHSDTLKDLPDQVAQKVLPRVVILEDSVSKLSARMTSVEKRQWIVAGGFSAAILFLKYGPALVALKGAHP